MRRHRARIDIARVGNDQRLGYGAIDGSRDIVQQVLNVGGERVPIAGVEKARDRRAPNLLNPDRAHHCFRCTIASMLLRRLGCRRGDRVPSRGRDIGAIIA